MPRPACHNAAACNATRRNTAMRRSRDPQQCTTAHRIRRQRIRRQRIAGNASPAATRRFDRVCAGAAQPRAPKTAPGTGRGWGGAGRAPTSACSCVTRSFRSHFSCSASASRCSAFAVRSSASSTTACSGVYGAARMRAHAATAQVWYRGTGYRVPSGAAKQCGRTEGCALWAVQSSATRARTHAHAGAQG